MLLNGKSLDKITESDLQELIDNGVAEGKTLDYKEKLSGNSDAEKKEFLYDVSSFANASGGNLIFGITHSFERILNTSSYTLPVVEEAYCGKEGKIIISSGLVSNISLSVSLIEGF